MACNRSRMWSSQAELSRGCAAMLWHYWERRVHGLLVEEVAQELGVTEEEVVQLVYAQLYADGTRRYEIMERAHRRWYLVLARWRTFEDAPRELVLV